MYLGIQFKVEEEYINNEELNQVNSVIDYLTANIPSVKLDEVLEELEDIKRAIITTEMQKLLQGDINDALARKYFDDLADQYDANNHYKEDKTEIVDKQLLWKIVNYAEEDGTICSNKAIVIRNCINSNFYKTKKEVLEAIYDNEINESENFYNI